MKKLSVVVPVYNVEQYLKRCVDSIINQNYPNIEIILVDDGSKDSSGKLCDFFAKQDKRIKVIHQTNGGLSSARNTGIENASGYYINFLDSDDELLPNIFNDLIPLMEKNGLDIIVYSSQKIKNGNIKKEKHTGKFVVWDRKTALVNDLSNDGGCVWNKIYSKKAIDNVKFPVGRLFEDTATGYKFIANSDKVGYIDKVYHNYYYNPDSITNTSFNVKARWDYVLAREEVYNYCVNNNLPSEKVNGFLIKALLSCLTAIYAKNDENNKIYYDKIKKLLKIYTFEYSNKYLSFKYKIFLYSFDKFDFIHKISAKLSKYAKLIKRKI